MDWTTIQNAIQAWMASGTGLACIWAEQGAPQPAYPFGTLKTISGPGAYGMDEVTETTDTMRAANVKVTPVAAEGFYYIDLNERSAGYIAGPGATVADICSGLTESLEALSEPIAVTDNGTDIDIVCTDPTGTFTIHTISEWGSLTWVNSDHGHEVEQTATGPRHITISCQVISDASGPAADARYYLERAQARLSLPTVIQALLDAGLSILDRGTVQDISFLAGGRRLTRCALDVRFGLSSEVSEQIGYIARTQVFSELGDVDADIELDHVPMGEPS